MGTPILLLDSEESCSRVGVLKRIPEAELSTPEEFYERQQGHLVHIDLDADDESPKELDVEEGGSEDTAEVEPVTNESTPLLASSTKDDYSKEEGSEES